MPLCTPNTPPTPTRLPVPPQAVSWGSWPHELLALVLTAETRRPWCPLSFPTASPWILAKKRLTKNISKTHPPPSVSFLPRPLLQSARKTANFCAATRHAAAPLVTKNLLMRFATALTKRTTWQNSIHPLMKSRVSVVLKTLSVVDSTKPRVRGPMSLLKASCVPVAQQTSFVSRCPRDKAHFWDKNSRSRFCQRHRLVSKINQNWERRAKVNLIWRQTTRWRAWSFIWSTLFCWALTCMLIRFYSDWAPRWAWSSSLLWGVFAPLFSRSWWLTVTWNMYSLIVWTGAAY